MPEHAASPLTLRITFTGNEDDDAPPRFRLYCHDLDVDAGPFPFTDPLDETDRADLRWYVEQWPR